MANWFLPKDKLGPCILYVVGWVGLAMLELTYQRWFCECVCVCVIE